MEGVENNDDQYRRVVPRTENLSYGDNVVGNVGTFLYNTLASFTNVPYDFADQLVQEGRYIYNEGIGSYLKSAGNSISSIANSVSSSWNTPLSEQLSTGFQIFKQDMTNIDGWSTAAGQTVWLLLPLKATGGKAVAPAAPAITNAAKGGFSVNSSKFDYFFGRVVTGSEHNIARSAQNLKDLTTLGIKNESQLMNVFGQALKSGTVISTKTSQYGTTVMRSVNIGNQGSINVGFFYQGGNMSAIPSVSTIIPKIFK
jgi:hypothetical protein